LACSSAHVPLSARFDRAFGVGRKIDEYCGLVDPFFEAAAAAAINPGM
jgi:hypothetical protein